MAGQDQAPKAVGQQTTIREIEEAREDLARTIDAIADKVSPANVARRTAGELSSVAQRTAGELSSVAQRTAGKLRERVQSVDPRLAGAGAVVVVGVVAFLVWRRRR